MVMRSLSHPLGLILRFGSVSFGSLICNVKTITCSWLSSQCLHKMNEVICHKYVYFQTCLSREKYFSTDPCEVIILFTTLCSDLHETFQNAQLVYSSRTPKISYHRNFNKSFHHPSEISSMSLKKKIISQIFRYL